MSEPTPISAGEAYDANNPHPVNGGAFARHPNDRPGSEKRTPVQIDPDVYDAIRRLAAAEDRTIVRYVNRVLRQHVEEEINDGR